MADMSPKKKGGAYDRPWRKAMSKHPLALNTHEMNTPNGGTEGSPGPYADLNYNKNGLTRGHSSKRLGNGSSRLPKLDGGGEYGAFITNKRGMGPESQSLQDMPRPKQIDYLAEMRQKKDE